MPDLGVGDITASFAQLRTGQQFQGSARPFAGDDVCVRSPGQSSHDASVSIIWLDGHLVSEEDEVNIARRVCPVAGTEAAQVGAGQDVVLEDRSEEHTS